MTRDRFAYIDALRGLAVLYVLVYHLALQPTPALAMPYWASPIIVAGGTGVTLFFVVSAFTLCHTMRVRANEAQPTLGFYLRRIFRIVPLFYVWLLLSLLRDWTKFGVTYAPAQMVLDASFLFNLVPGQEASIVWAGWTLGVEMLFYLFFPLFWHAVTNIQRALAFVLLAVAGADVFQYAVGYLHLAPPVRDSFLEFGFLNILPVFACGMLAYHIYATSIQGRSLERGWSLVLVAGAVFGYSALLASRLDFLWPRLYWQAVIYGSLLLGLAVAPLRLFVNRLLVFYGQLSYSLYLAHATVISYLIPIYRMIYTWPIGVTLRFGICLLLTCAVATPLAYLTYRLIELPGIQLGRWLIKKITTRPAQPQPVGTA